MESHNEYTNIKGATTTQVYTGACTLERIIVNTATAGTIGIIDGTSGTTVNVGTITPGASQLGVGTYWYGVTCGLGIRIVTSASPDITVVWRVK